MCWINLKNNRAPLLCYFKLCASYRSHCWIQTGGTVRKRPIWVKIDVFLLHDLVIWRMTLKNNRIPLLCYFKICASFRSHWWIQTGVRVWKRPIEVKIEYFLSHMTWKFDRWPSKTIGHLFYAISSFVHHFVATGEFKLELQSRNAQLGWKSIIFWTAWPWNLTDDLGKQ